MEKHSTCVVLILAFLQTGRTNIRISIKQRQEHTSLVVTCDLRGEDNVAQINWEKMNGSSRAIVGIIHPKYGIHIPKEYMDSIEILESAHFHSSSLILNQVDENNITRYCCIFITFPSGNLPDCIEVTNMKTAEPAPQQRFQVPPERLLLGVFVIPIIIIITATIYLSWQHFCSRRRVFQVQQTTLSNEEEDLQAILSLQIEAEAFDAFLSTLRAKLEHETGTGSLEQESRLVVLEEEQLRHILLDPSVSSQIELPGHVIIQDWQPLKLVESNLEVLRRQNLTWLADSLEQPTFLSLHTPPYSVPYKGGVLPLQY